MKKFKILYTDPLWAINSKKELDPSLANIEKESFGNDAEIHFGKWDGKAYQKEIPAGYDAVVIYRSQVTEDVANALKSTTKVIARQGVGYDNLGIPHLNKAGIIGFNIPDYCVDEVSTHTMALLLGLERKLCIQNDRLKAGHWNIFEGGMPRRLQNCTVGLVGTGRIGKSTARKLNVFYKTILGFDPYVSADEMLGHGIHKVDDLKNFLGACDVVIFHTLLNEETKFMGNVQFFSHMKKDALVVNTARGNLIEPEAIYQALVNKQIGGFATDVFTPEDPHEHPVNKKIVAMENVVVTSHRAFLSKESEYSQRKRIADEVLYVLKTGEMPRFGVQTKLVK